MVTPPVSAATGQRIAQARRAAGLSRYDLAKPAGLRIWDLEQIESGKAEPTDDMLRAMAERLSCSPLWLRSGASVVPMDDKRGDELDERERALDERERGLDEREAALLRREAALVEAEPPPAPAQAPTAVGSIGAWNIDTIARLVAAHGALFPDRVDEWQATLQAMRAVVRTDGALTPELDALARDVFAPLLRGAA